MKQRLFKSIFLTCMTVFLLAFLLLPGWIYRITSREDRELLENEGRLAAAVLENGGVEALDRAVSAKCDVTWLTADGTILFDDDGETGVLSMSADIVQALKTGKGSSVDFSDGMHHLSLLLSDGTVLRMSSQQQSVFSLTLQMFTPMVVLIFTAVILSALVASRIARSATEPLNKIDLERPDERDVDDELKPLIRRVAEQNRRIQSQLRELSEEHDRQDRLRREFTANVSHELKTPLTSISGFAELIRDGMVRPEDVRPFAGRIYDETQRLISLVGDILKLSRLEENSGMPELEPVSLYERAQSVLRQLEPLAQRNSVTMTLEGTAGELSAIPRIVEEMVYNLCDNALKYNRAGGNVAVTVTEDETQAAITVRDTGIGIPEEDVPRIFERFYRVDKSHSREIGGTGLGLSIVKHGAQNHGAEISVESRLGEGTAITVIFPKKGACR